jgi:RNA polymerase sigma-70 factor, ECF subfamily
MVSSALYVVPASPGGTELEPGDLAQAQRGEEQACRLLFRHFQPRVTAYLWRMLGVRMTAAGVEDLTQEAFLRIFRALPGFRPEGRAQLSTWIFTICHRLAINELRRLGRRCGEPECDEADRPGGERPDARAEQAELGRRIQAALEGLTEEQRAVFLLSDYHELALEQVGLALEIPLGTVKSRLARARAALRTALEKDHG